MISKPSRRGVKFCLYSFFLILLLLAISLNADAAPPQVEVGVFNQITELFASKVKAWGNIFLGFAKTLFISLAAISLVWTFAQMAIRGGELGEFFFEFIRFIIVFGFFFWLLNNGIDIATSIIKSFAMMGSNASGATVAAGEIELTPSGIVNVGFVIFGMTISNMSILPWNMAESLLGGLIGLGCLVLMTIIAVNYMMMLCSAWIMIYAGVFTLGFGGSKWTSDIALNYFKHVISIGMQIMVLMLIVGIGLDFVETLYSQQTNKALENIQVLGLLLAIMLVVAALSLKVPPILGGLITGSSLGSTGATMGFGMAAAAGTMALGAAAGVAAQGAGGLQAVREAYHAAGNGNDGSAVGSSRGGGGSEGGSGTALSSVASGLTSSGSTENNKIDQGAFSNPSNPDAFISSFENDSSSGAGESNVNANTNTSSNPSSSQPSENSSNNLSSGEQPQKASFTRRVMKTAQILAAETGNAAAHNINQSTQKTVGGKMARRIKKETN